jgi:hypothetical protein
MAKIKLADAVRRLNDHYDADLSYQQLYMLGLQRRIPVERNETGRFWVVDEANLTAMAKALGLAPAKPKAKPKLAAADTAAKPKAAASKPARQRASRPAA